MWLQGVGWCLRVGAILMLANSVSTVVFAAAEGARACPPDGSLGDVATFALIKKASTVEMDDFRDYWRDVHGILAARIPGFWTYTQYHLGREIALSRSRSSGLLAAGPFSPAVAEPLHGFVEVTYCNASDSAGLASSTVTELIKADERNAFAASYLYGTQPGDSATSADAYDKPLPLVSEAEGALVVLLARSPEEGRASFRASFDAMLDALPQLCPKLQFARAHFFMPYQADAWQAPDVDRVPAVVYDAAVELKLPDRAVAEACLADAAVSISGEAPPGRTLRVFPIAARYRMVKNGEPTLLGLRGLSAYQVIVKLDATNQMSGDVLNILYGRFE